MARVEDRLRARELRSQGKSYSEIRDVLNVSKSTLNYWLRDMPLPEARMRELRDRNPRRIEKFRNTMRLKREARLSTVLERVKKDIGRITRRDLFVAGLFLYWAEGTKNYRGKVELANTDPAVIRAFLAWLQYMGVPKNAVAVRLQLYKDMDVSREISYWSRVLDIPQKQFRLPYVKAATVAGLSRKRGHGHGTCDLIFDNVALSEYITMALNHIRESFLRP